MKRRARARDARHLEIVMRRYERAGIPCDHSIERVAYCRDELGITPVCGACGLILE